MEASRATDLMIPIEEYPWVRPDRSLRDAMSMLDAPRFDIVASSGRLSLPWVLLVIDQQGALVGVLRRRDLIRGLGPWSNIQAEVKGVRRIFPVGLDPNLSSFSRHMGGKGFKEWAERPVREVMQPIRATVDHEDHLDQVIEKIVREDVSLVPVLQGGKVIGVVSVVDVFYEISRIVLQ